MSVPKNAKEWANAIGIALLSNAFTQGTKDFLQSVRKQAEAKLWISRKQMDTVEARIRQYIPTFWDVWEPGTTLEEVSDILDQPPRRIPLRTVEVLPSKKAYPAVAASPSVKPIFNPFTNLVEE